MWHDFLQSLIIGTLQQEEVVVIEDGDSEAEGDLKDEEDS